MFYLNFHLNNHDAQNPELLEPEIITLESDMIRQAAHLSAQIPNIEQRWQVYINRLGLSAIDEWFSLHNPTFNLDQSNCSLFKLAHANLLPIVCNLYINEFRIALIVVENPLDEAISIPRFAVELNDFAAHFYILLEVQEEQGQVILRGCIRYDQIQSTLRQYTDRIEQAELTESQSYYLCPWDLFDPKVYHIFHYCEFLKPDLILLPDSSKKWQSLVQSADMIESLPWKTLVENRVPAFELLSYEQLEFILYCPPLVNLIYVAQSQSISVEAIVQHTKTLITQLAQPAVRIQHWFQQQSDHITEYVCRQPQQLAFDGLRRTSNAFDHALDTICEDEDLQIPDTAQLMPIEIPDQNLELYVVSWLLDNQDEWAMLAVLVPAPGTILPKELCFHAWLKDNSSFWVDKAVSGTDDHFDYIYFILEGSLDEAFVLAVQLPNQLPITLPAFPWIEA
jgi:hypothetical protein